MSAGRLRRSIPTSPQAFFEPFAAEVDPKVHGVGVWDQAGFHTAGKLKVPDNVTLVPSAYSPELNRVENLRHYFRSHYGSNRTDEDYDDLRQAAIEARQKAALDSATIRSVCRTPYA